MIVGCLPPFKALIPSTFSHHSPSSPDTGTWGRGWYHFNWNFNSNSRSHCNNRSGNPLSSRNRTKRSEGTVTVTVTVTTSQSEEQLPIQLRDRDTQENPKDGYGMQQGGGVMVDIVDDDHPRHISTTANEVSFYNDFTDEEPPMQRGDERW
jgi:hypothetical protein